MNSFIIKSINASQRHYILLLFFIFRQTCNISSLSEPVAAPGRGQPRHMPKLERSVPRRTKWTEINGVSSGYSKTAEQTHVSTVSVWWHSTFYCHYDRLDTSGIQLSWHGCRLLSHLQLPQRSFSRVCNNHNTISSVSLNALARNKEYVYMRSIAKTGKMARSPILQQRRW